MVPGLVEIICFRRWRPSVEVCQTLARKKEPSVEKRDSLGRGDVKTNTLSASWLAVPPWAWAALGAGRWETVGAVCRNWSRSRNSPEHSTETAGWQAGRFLVNKLNNKQRERLSMIPAQRKPPFWKGINPCHHCDLQLLCLSLQIQTGLSLKAWLRYQWRATQLG